MGRDQARALVAKWREQARALHEIQEFWSSSNVPNSAVLIGAKYAREAFEKCADDLDLAFGRIS
jgi:hypothetical protein